MLFNSLDYLIFFPLVFIVYFVLPKRVRYLWLLAASYYFYACWNARYALLMLTSTVITYASGLLIDRFRRGERPGLCRWTVAGSFALNLFILGFFKYGNFIIENVNGLLAAVGSGGHVGALDVLLPVGISFYTFQALSYTMDVYRGDVAAERNLARYALFVSFFPQLVAGPIERSKNLLTQLQSPPDFDAKKASNGIRLILWGLFVKMVIADNLSGMVMNVYGNFRALSGIEILLGTMLFAVQIYCDFSGYSYIAIGSANIMGYDLMENFRSPYLSASVGEFWRRWHISLSTWFRDYLYIPLGGSRRGTARKYLNTMIVFVVSGLWHGANWTFVVWGALNGAMIVLGEATKGLRMRAADALHVNRQAWSYKFFQRLITFLLINLTWIYFRAPDIATANQMLARVFTDLNLRALLSAGVWDIFFNMQTMALVFFSVLLLVATDVIRYRGTTLDVWMGRQNALFRYGVYAVLLLVIFAFGIYGRGFGQTQFIYFQF